VTEGLADHFVAEAFPDTPPQPWDNALSGDQETDLWRQAIGLAGTFRLRPSGVVFRRRRPSALGRLHPRIPHRPRVPRR
jgi:hypothetical protein